MISGISKTNSTLSVKEDPKDGGSDHIAAQTFVFRELAAATRNFRAECLLGEGGFGRVYKGRLESTNQVRHDYLFILLNMKKFSRLETCASFACQEIELLICTM